MGEIEIDTDREGVEVGGLVGNGRGWVRGFRKV